MTVECPNCENFSVTSSSRCEYCNHPLQSHAELIELLIRKQEALESRHQEELGSLRLELLRLKEQMAGEEIDTPLATPDAAETVFTTEAEVQDPIRTPQANVKAEKWLPPAKQEIKVQEPREPSRFELQIRSFLEPLYNGIDLISEIYARYKREGKLPIFFMTLAGVVAILFGFGYFMQYSLQALGEYENLAKVGLGFLASLISMIIGIRLTKRNDKFKEYASALISLGIILNYVMIYSLSSLGNFPALSSSLVGFLLIVINTALAIALSLKFETKIVAVLFVVGGALAPFYLESNEDGTWYYLYLWLLTLGGCIVATKIQWKALQYLSFSISAILVEMMVFAQEPTAFQYTIYYHLFAYLFFYYTLFDKGHLKTTWEKTDVIILAANLSFFTWNLYSANAYNLTYLGLLYFGNAVVFVGVFARWKKAIPRKVQLILFAIIGVLIGFAVPSLLDQSLMGLFWSIEGILLIYFGFLYSMDLVRKEGYLLLAIAMFKMGSQSLVIIELWDETVWHTGLLNYTIMGLIVSGCWFWGQRFSETFNDLERNLFAIFREIVPLWIASIFFIITYALFGNWSFNLAFIPAFGMIYWGRQFDTKTSMLAGLIYPVMFLIGFVISAGSVQSLHFSDQLLFAQIGMAQWMACLWLMKSYYKALKIEDQISYRIAKGLRVTFFCLLPLLFLHLVRRHMIEWFTPASWVSVLMAYALFRRLRYSALRLEVLLLSLGAVTLTFQGFEISGLMAGIFALVALTFAERSYDMEGWESSLFKPLMLLTPYLVAGMVALLYFNFSSDDYATSVAIGSSVLLALSYFKANYAPIQKSLVVAIRLAATANFIALAGFFIDNPDVTPFLASINLVIFGVLLHNGQGWYDLEKKVSRWNTAMSFHQLQVMLAYVSVIIFMGLDPEGPLFSVLLVVHAIILMFIAMKNQNNFLNKLSLVFFGVGLLKVVFHDIRDFDTSEKVIVLIVLGMLLLGASYLYVKFKKKFEGEEE